MNTIFITGRAGNVKVYPPKREGQKTMMVIGIADKYWNGKEQTVQWWNCKVYGKKAENIQQWISKGTMCSVVGRLQPDDYTREDGTTRGGFQVYVDQIDFFNGPRRDEPAKHDEDVVKHEAADNWDDVPNF